MDAHSIKATPQLGEELASALGRPDLEIRLGLEVSPDGSQAQRIALADRTGSWRLAILGSSFDLSFHPTDFAGSNLADFQGFAAEAGEVLSVAADFLGRIGHRLALVQEGLLQEMSGDELGAAADRLLQRPAFFVENPPFEWDWRCASRTELIFGEHKEPAHFIGTVKRVGATLSVGNSTQELDRLMLQVDLNTAPTNTRGRFRPEGVKAFFKEAAIQQRAIRKAILEHIGG